jgi:hypothetical protein
MLMDNQEFSALIEEYKTLREECLKVFEQRTIPLVYMSLIIVTLIGGGLQFKKDFIFSLVLTSIFPVALHWIGKRYTVARISYYIKTEIEPRIKGLNWENWVWHDRDTKLDDIQAWIVSSGVISFYIMIGLACALYYTLKNFPFLPYFSLGILIYNILLGVVLLILLWMCSGKRYVSRVRGIEDDESKPTESVS